MNDCPFFYFRKTILLFLLLIPGADVLADWNNFIINYNKNLYGKGAQTWQIAPYNENWIYFANNRGMLQYDGDKWSVFPLNNESDVRSISPSAQYNRIYAGGISEFGYFEPDNSGKLVYTCMSDSINETERNIGNIWGIHESDNILYVQADGTVVKVINDKYTQIPSPWKIDCSGLANGVLYVGTDNGVWLLVGNSFFPLQGGDLLKTKRIRGIIPHKEGVLIVTAYSGLYYYNGQNIVPFYTGTEEFQARHEVFCVAANDKYIALGTVHKGIILIDRTTFAVKYYNENNGLQNNTVLSLSFDASGNLWAGLDNGIDYICLTSYLTNLYTSRHSLGTGYAAILSKHNLYIGTNRGLYYTEYPVKLTDDRPAIYPVANSSGQVWDLKQIGNDLFCMHDRGIFLVKGNTMEKITPHSGIWTCELVSGTTDKMFMGVYNGVYLMEKKNGTWQVSHKIEGIEDSFRFFQQESAQILWMTDSKKLFRIELNSDLTRMLNQELIDEERGLPPGSNAHILKVSGKVLFSTTNGLYEYDNEARKLRLSEMNKLVSGAGPYFSMIETNGNLYGINNREIFVSHVNPYKQGAGTYTIPIDIPSVELVHGAETFTLLSDSLLIIPNDNGFALLKVPSIQSREKHLPEVCIRNVFISHPKDSLIYTDNFLGRKEMPFIDYAKNAIRIEYGVRGFIGEKNVRYQYRMDNNEWSDLTTSNIKEYSKLPEGLHTFMVKAVLPDAVSVEDTFTFRIFPPWYRSNLAYIFYFLIFLIIIWLVYRWDDVRLKRKKAQAVIEKDKEMKAKVEEFEQENARKEKQIIQLEKEKLQHDLQYKSQEMANLMINFARKNEILTEIKSDLYKAMSALKGEGSKESRRMLLVTSNKIDSNIQSDDVLKRIEEQFDLVHNNFMKKLQQAHPDLSLNERMMCAYLKMNLSTKEIAPLLNISVRGVETIRYRIRKKFNLEREDSLTEYLNTKF